MKIRFLHSVNVGEGWGAELFFRQLDQIHNSHKIKSALKYCYQYFTFNRSFIYTVYFFFFYHFKICIFFYKLTNAILHHTVFQRKENFKQRLSFSRAQIPGSRSNYYFKNIRDIGVPNNNKLSIGLSIRKDLLLCYIIMLTILINVCPPFLNSFEHDPFSTNDVSCLLSLYQLLLAT